MVKDEEEELGKDLLDEEGGLDELTDILDSDLDLQED